MSDVNFAELLNKPAETAKRPPQLPPGDYEGVIGTREFGVSAQKKTPYVRFHYTLTGAKDNVDLSEFTESGGNLSAKKLRSEFYLTPDARYRLIEFAESCGVEKKGMTDGQIIEELIGKPVLIEVTMRNSQDGSEQYENVKKVVGL